ncbi:discoidin domain-containing protein [Hephaestia sp. CMS5P-6]|nr:discoidin domain-containing protein [Hephaestia mangrovi]
MAIVSIASIGWAGCAVAAPGRALPVSGTVRTRLNFNAGWRFERRDVPDGQNPALDDADWQRVGLPHSFSIPYFQSPSFYVGYGWYRKSFDLPALAKTRHLFLEFEGVFQVADVFVNGVRVGGHRGGYTGFSIDITDAVHPGRNLVAVRVNNKWDPTLAPRAGEHVFSGGIYRDVWLVATNGVHVTWTGTRITTPDLSAASGRVAADTEVRNDADHPVRVRVQSSVVSDHGATVATLPDTTIEIGPQQTVTAHQLSAPIAHPHLWSPDTPTLYRVKTRLLVGGNERDRYQTEFGFRWFKWTADKGFFLNGKHLYFRGANVHQDQAGWGDAVTDKAIDRDVQLMKDAGFDFIRGSHYPHDPHFAEATDRIGMMFLSEESFWGTAGFKNPWGASAYPTDPANQAAFDASVLQQLAEMIRINRNHPSIVAWGMDNEVFFSTKETMPNVRHLLREEVALAHKLDPTRPASIDGAQRGDIDHLGDIVGYNGDGAFLFPDPGIPNFVAEYGSTISDRPGEYAPGWGDLPKTPGAKPDQPYSWRLPWRSGEVIWAGFDHGSIAGRYGRMGIVDYSRLPKRSWYWYRHAYRGIAPPPWPKPGEPAALRLTSSSPTIRHADGTDDVQLVITVVDASGKPISNSPPVTLAIVSGPGELPTGRSITFSPDGDIPIRDGKAAIAMRSYRKGVTRIRASSPGLRDGMIEIRTTSGPRFVPGVTPVAADRPYIRFEGDSGAAEAETVLGTNNPTAASSSAEGHSSRLVNDGNPATYWQAAPGDTRPWIIVDPERILQYHRLRIRFPQAAPYGLTIDVRMADGTWKTVAHQPVGGDTGQERDLALPELKGGPVRVSIEAPPGVPAGVAEIEIVGKVDNR